MSSSPNMSYCMFQNTVEAMRQCIESDAYMNNDPPSVLSAEEEHAFHAFVRLCNQVSMEFGQ